MVGVIDDVVEGEEGSELRRSPDSPQPPYSGPVDEAAVPLSLEQRREEELARYQRRILDGQEEDDQKEDTL